MFADHASLPPSSLGGHDAAHSPRVSTDRLRAAVTHEHDDSENATIFVLNLPVFPSSHILDATGANATVKGFRWHPRPNKLLALGLVFGLRNKALLIQRI